ncbi:hypothetical protein MLD38_039754 [Melastoma candidum]|uniref:Uncharacterized protein n=1 Tax=Melastoma candidum TaxID=119954 RepID=A0ACB9L307_9MYRT|nr:hypothetical protein MLD38_039754 [Melastoma candidum]
MHDAEVTAPNAEMNFAREEDAMWQRIYAVRRIVGYKAARQATFMEELKALYLFTGVEPPASFKDTSDLEEVGEKLRFLLSVVGVE